MIASVVAAQAGDDAKMNQVADKNVCKVAVANSPLQALSRKRRTDQGGDRIELLARRSRPCGAHAVGISLESWEDVQVTMHQILAGGGTVRERQGNSLAPHA
jgi:hypothetical protein